MTVLAWAICSASELPPETPLAWLVPPDDASPSADEASDLGSTLRYTVEASVRMDSSEGMTNALKRDGVPVPSMKMPDAN